MSPSASGTRSAATPMPISRRAYSCWRSPNAGARAPMIQLPTASPAMNVASTVATASAVAPKTWLSRRDQTTSCIRPAAPETRKAAPSARIPLADPESRGVLGRHHDDVAAAVPAVDVLLLVDDGVELSLGAERRQTELPRGRREGRNRRDVEMGLPVVREERRLVQHPAGHVELAARPVDVADRRIAGNDSRHLLPQ